VIRREHEGRTGAELRALQASVAGEVVLPGDPRYDDARRRVAKDLRVDPYTTNAPLARKLDEVAWAQWSGEFGLSMAVSLVPGGAALMFTKNWVSDLVWDLVNARADVNVKNDEGNTALMEAATSNNLEALKTLLDAGAEVNVKNKQG